jgi:hypothetical protein
LSEFTFEQLFAAWRAASGHRELGPPASEAEIALTEANIGRPLPDEIKQVYREVNGLSFHGLTMLYPLRGSDLSVESLNDFMSEGSDPFPECLRVFGSDGSEGNYMFWSDPVRPPYITPVVTFPMIDDVECYFLSGTSVLRFLVAITAADRCYDEDFAPVEILGMPRHLFAAEPDEVAIISWADPSLPNPGSEKLYSEAGLRELFE